MPCTSPLTAYKPLSGGPLKFGKEPRNAREIQINCGQCMDCRLRKSAEWAMRMVCESRMHTRNSFITLTYNDESLPEHGTLHKPHLQLFCKRLRERKHAFRYYACGEYGDLTQRAHYHACLFGMDFDDKIEIKRQGDTILYDSKQLKEIWGHGNVSVGELNFETAAYTARYVTKKLSKGQSRYVRIDEATGEIIPLQQPFAVMSLRPAVGRTWFEQYHGDIYNADKDFLVMRGKKQKPPKYYDALYDVVNNDHMEYIKHKRQQNHVNMTRDEQRARAEITHARNRRKQTL